MFKSLKEAINSTDSVLVAQMRQNFDVDVKNGAASADTTDEDLLKVIAKNRPPGLPDDEYFDFVKSVFDGFERPDPFTESVQEAVADYDPALRTQQGRDNLQVQTLNKLISKEHDTGPAQNVANTATAAKLVSLLKKHGIDWPGGPKNAAFLKLRSTADLKDPSKVDRQDRLGAESGPQSWVWQLVPLGKGPNPQGFRIGSGIPAGDFAKVDDIAWSATRQNGVRMIDVEIPGRGSR